MVSKSPRVAQVRTNLSLCEFDLSKLYEFYVTPDRILHACKGNDTIVDAPKAKRTDIAPALVLAVFRTLCDFTRRNQWQRCDPIKDVREGAWEHRTWLTQEEMGARALVSISTVQRALDVLRLMGLVRIEAHQINRMKTRNVTWVQFTESQVAFARDPAHRRAHSAQEVTAEYEAKFAPARGHTVQEIEEEKLRREEIARAKLAKKGLFVRPPCLNTAKPDFATEVRPNLKTDFEGTPEADRASTLAMGIGIELSMARKYAIHSPKVLVELVTYSMRFKNQGMRAGYVCKHFQRFVVGKPYGQAENELRWTKSAQTRTLADIKRGRRGQFGTFDLVGGEG